MGCGMGELDEVRYVCVEGCEEELACKTDLNSDQLLDSSTADYCILTALVLPYNLSKKP